jgi:hypothetical protein
MIMAIGILELLIVLVLLGGLVGAAVFVVVVFSQRSGSSQANNPNLQPCPDCGRLISVRAATCPGCGSPIKNA